MSLRIPHLFRHRLIEKKVGLAVPPDQEKSINISDVYLLPIYLHLYYTMDDCKLTLNYHKM